jgi:hypothetical protein
MGSGSKLPEMRPLFMAREQSRSMKGTDDPDGRTDSSVWLKSANSEKPRVLIVSDDDTISEELEIILFHAGLLSAHVDSMTAGYESARSGQYQVVVTEPVLFDGSWKRLIDIAGRYRPGFVIILVATSSDPSQRVQALEDGAFGVVDALNDLPKVAAMARGACWAAYLKGAGPCPEAKRRILWVWRDLMPLDDLAAHDARKAVAR